MAALDNVLTILDKFPLWRRMKEAPDKLDTLEKRVAELEEKLGDTWPADVCKFCGARAARMVWSVPHEKGLTRQDWKCGECEHTEVRTIKP